MVINKHIKLAEKMATLLDSRFHVLGLTFGFDPLLDLIPGLGSIVGAMCSCYIFWIAAKLNVPKMAYFKMALNIFFDLILGEVPFIGIFLDVFYKSNIRNINILKKYVKLNSEVVDAEIVE